MSDIAEKIRAFCDTQYGRPRAEAEIAIAEHTARLLDEKITARLGTDERPIARRGDILSFLRWEISEAFTELQQWHRLMKAIEADPVANAAVARVVSELNKETK